MILPTDATLPNLYDPPEAWEFHDGVTDQWIASYTWSLSVCEFHGNG